MALPTSRSTLKEYILKNLGHPMLRIDVTDEQIEDRIDEAMAYYVDYHYDATDLLYYKVQVEEKHRPDRINSIRIVSGGNNYSNSDTITFSAPLGANASANIITNASGTIISVPISNNGADYSLAPTITINTATGSGASLLTNLGGFIDIPENIIGVNRIFDMGSAFNTQSLFSTTYQFFMNDFYSLSSMTLAPYYMAMQHVTLLQELLIGKQPLRYNRHKNRLYIDMDWRKVNNGNFIVIECHEVIDPEEFVDVWKDRWLLRYSTALVKRQWGMNTKKFSGMTLPNGITINGQQIYDEAIAEISKLEGEMLNSYSLPVTDLLG